MKKEEDVIMAIKYLKTPLSEEEARALRTGDVVYLSGSIYTARDMGHLRIRSCLDAGEPLPCLLEGAALFHAGPVVLKDENDNWRLNVIGPTTSIRMEPYAQMVGKLGVKVIIGKGGMGEDTLAAARQYGYVYLQAAPGCAAKLAQGIRGIAKVDWLDMGMPEALWSLEAENFGPLVVGMDTNGQSIYKDLGEAARAKMEQLYPTGA